MMGDIKIKNALCYLFAIFFICAGVLHFVRGAAFAAIVPPLLPFPYVIVWITGLIEIALAIVLLCPHFRRDAGIALGLYLLAVLPANIYMAMAGLPFGNYSASPTALWIRVALQFPLIALILWACGVFDKKRMR